MRLFLYVFMLIFGVNKVSFSQNTDSTINLKGVTIQSDKYSKYLIGQDIEHIDTFKIQLFASKSIAQLLQSESNINIKQYSNTGLVTLGVRGTSSSQFCMMWSGLTQQSSMNGIIDLNLFSTGLFSNISFAKGGSSSLSGVGAIGSVLILENQKVNKILGIEIGSFGMYNQNIQWGIQKNKWFHQSSFFHSYFKNDFQYSNFTKIGKPIEINKNGISENTSYTNSTKYTFNKNNILECNFWWMNAKRFIPPTMTEGESDAVQNDNFAKLGLKFTTYIQNKTIFTSKIGLSDDYNVYESSLVPRSYNHTFDYIFENIIEKDFGNSSAYLGINITKNKAFSSNLSLNRSRLRIPFFFGLKNQSKSIKTSFLVRTEWIENENLVITGHIGVEKQLNSNTIGLSFSRNFNLPTFNDLYWFSGGNPELLAETSHNLNLNYNYKKEDNHFQINTYAILINNWIQWIPNGAQFSPVNYKQVLSRGAEFNLNKKMESWDYKIGYSYNKTSNTKIFDGDTAILNKELTYTPNHLLNFSIDYHTKLLQVGLQSNIIGNRFTTPRNEVENTMPTFGVTNFYFLKSYKQFLLQLEINNIFNTQYQYFQFRQMPGINYKLSLKYKI